MKAKSKFKIVHTAAELGALSVEQLNKVIARATDYGVDAAVEAAKAELKKRPIRKGSKITHGNHSELKTYDRMLADLANDIGKVSDQHAVTGSDGGAKVSGDKMNGKYVFEKYISQRSGDQCASLALRLESENSEPILVFSFGHYGNPEVIEHFSLSQFDVVAKQYRAAVEKMM